ncbi:TWK-18 protein [Aphelenchoides avenae]|nr:TWK-18 protein [Aphelenchus avenae]
MSPIQAYNHTIATLVRYRDQLGVGPVNLNDTKWNMWGAIYFSFTVYTTIGYGNITPGTNTGRVLTIIYAFIGIPLALLALIALGGLLAKLALALWKFLVRSMGCLSKDLERKIKTLGPDETASEAESEDSSDELLRFPVSFLIFLTVLWIFLCAYLFLLWEDTWDYGTSLYFILISFTTIGFGDVIPSKSNYIILVGILLLVGLALVSTILTIIQKQIEALASGMKDTIDKEYMEALQQAADETGVDIRDIEAGDGMQDNEYDKSANAKGAPGAKGAKGRKGSPNAQLEEVIKRMPLKSRVLYHVMPAGNRKQLAKHAKQRQRVGMQWVQTDPWLMEDSAVVPENPNY